MLTKMGHVGVFEVATAAGGERFHRLAKVGDVINSAENLEGSFGTADGTDLHREDELPFIHEHTKSGGGLSELEADVFRGGDHLGFCEPPHVPADPSADALELIDGLF